MINTVTLVGRLTKDPELKYTPSGIAHSSFTVAVNRNFTNQNGEREADFINCRAWRKQAENLAKFMKKGSLIGLEGRIETSSFDGRDGQRVFMTTVVADRIQFLESRNTQQSCDSQSGGYQQQNNYQNQGGYQQSQNSNNPFNPEPADNPFNPAPNSNEGIQVNDDDLPF